MFACLGPSKVRQYSTQSNIEIFSVEVHCLVCRKRRAETLTPMMAVLLPERLAFSSPLFTNTGLDYFGLFFVSVKRSSEKRWGYLFTCLATQTVHSEVVPSLDTSSFVITIERFVARRGVPSVIWSDYGTKFIAREKDILANVLSWNQRVLSDSMV